MKEHKNTAASVKQRLLNLSRQSGEEFNLLLVRYGIERLLYRLGRSEHAGEFILKGAMLFHLWTAAPHRPTRDVDLLGRGTPDLDRLQQVFRAVCATASSRNREPVPLELAPTKRGDGSSLPREDALASLSRPVALLRTPRLVGDRPFYQALV